jgi:biotin synthase
MNPRIAQIAESVLSGRAIDLREGQYLTSSTDSDLYDVLYWANRIRCARCGPAVGFCAIKPVTIGACSEDCAFCAQSARYRSQIDPPANVPDEEVVSAAERAAQVGAQCFGLVTSGRRPNAALMDRVVRLIGKLRQAVPSPLCASLGILDTEQARILRQAGLDRYNHNLETSAGFFNTVVTTHSYDDRLKTLAAVQSSGLSLCSGALFGMGETWSDRLDLAMALQEITPASVPLNFLHPMPDTPLANASPLHPTEILRIIAVFRFALPTAQIKVAGGREANLRDLQSWIFFAGASSALIGDYLTTTGRDPQADLQMVADLGLDSGPPPSQAIRLRSGQVSDDGPGVSHGITE